MQFPNPMLFPKQIQDAYRLREIVQPVSLTPHPDPFYTPRYLLHIHLPKADLMSQSGL